VAELQRQHEELQPLSDKHLLQGCIDKRADVFRLSAFKAPYETEWTLLDAPIDIPAVNVVAKARSQAVLESDDCALQVVIGSSAEGRLQSGLCRDDLSNISSEVVELRRQLYPESPDAGWVPAWESERDELLAKMDNVLVKKGRLSQELSEEKASAERLRDGDRPLKRKVSQLDKNLEQLL
jgi:hypothetical protein